MIGHFFIFSTATHIVHIIKHPWLINQNIAKGTTGPGVDCFDQFCIFCIFCIFCCISCIFYIFCLFCIFYIFCIFSNICTNVGLCILAGTGQFIQFCNRVMTTDMGRLWSDLCPIIRRGCIWESTYSWKQCHWMLLFKDYPFIQKDLQGA